jgi:hypothetical protein
MTKIINFYELSEVKALKKKSINPNFKFHGITVPFRSIIIGASGSGKTNILLNLISIMKNTFNKIMIYTRNKKEPLYEYLEEKIEPGFLEIHEGLDDLKNKKDSEYFGQFLIVFDDLCMERDQTVISELFIRGRKIEGGISLCYLSQSYFKIPSTIRQQSQYVFLKKIPNVRNIKLLLTEYSLSATKDEILGMYKYCIDGDFLNFLLIDLEATSEFAFRKGFNEILDHSAF